VVGVFPVGVESGKRTGGRLGGPGVACRAMRAIQLQEFGGPEVLQLVDLPTPTPGPGEVLVEVSRAGMNFADTHQRENSYLARAACAPTPASA
jgi:hypothetical protein